MLSPVQPPAGPGQSHGEPLHSGRGGGGVHGPQEYSLAQSGHRGQFEPSRGQFDPSFFLPTEKKTDHKNIHMLS